MSSKQQMRTIPFDDQKAIIAAIRDREDFEIGGCQGRMDEAVQLVERAIGSEGMTSRIYTKGRAGIALAVGVAALPIGIAAAAGLVAHNLASRDPDYEVMKRLIDKVLRLTYVKNDPTLKTQISGASSAFGRNITDVAMATSCATLKAAKSVSTATKIASQTISSSALERAQSLSEKANELTSEAVKSTAHKVSDTIGVLTGVKILETVNEMIELQEKYNDVLAEKLEEALIRIDILEEAIKSV